MNLTIDHYVCLTNRVRDALVVDLDNDFAPTPTEYVLRATGVQVRIFFCKRAAGALVAYDPGEDIGINYGAKRADQVIGDTSPTLFEVSAFTRDATDPENVFWLASLDLNTEEFADAFSSTNPIDLSASIEITEDGLEYPAAIFEALGIHDVLRDTDTPPTAALPPYPTTTTAYALLGGNSAGDAWVFYNTGTTGRAVLASASQATARTALGLGEADQPVWESITVGTSGATGDILFAHDTTQLDTLRPSAGAADRVIYLPPASGTLVTGDGAGVSPAPFRAAIGLPWAYSASGSSGLAAYFNGGTLASSDGSALTVASGSVTLPASATSIVGFDLYDLTFRALPRAIDSGFIPVARVVTGASSITSVTQLESPTLPASRLARTKAQLAQGFPVRVLLIGDSITAGTGGTSGNLWFELCFDVAQVAKSYNVPGAANITLTNLGISSSNAYHGLGSFAKLLAAPSTQHRHPSSVYLPTLPQITRGGLTTRAAGPNVLVRELPDLVIIALGTNAFGLAKDAELVETAVRGWRALGVEVLLGTTNARTDGYSTAFLDDADAIQAIADTAGAAIADTWAEIAQARLLGTTVTPDGVHPNDAGQLLYARAIRRNINTRAQLGENFGPTGLKVFRPSTSTQRPRCANAAWYQPFQGLGGGAASGSSAIATNYNVVLAGQSAGSAVANVPVSGTANFQCHDATAIILCYELASGATATIDLETSAGTNIKTGVSVTGLSSRTLFLEIATFADLEAMSSVIQTSGQRTHTIPVGGRLTVTAISGGPTTLGVQGFLFPSHDNTPLDWPDFEFSGTWAYEAARDDSSIQVPYSDTADSEFVVSFVGDALQLTLQTGSVSGSGATISAWLDGEQILTNAANDPYGGGSAGTFVNNVVLMPNNTGAASGKNFGRRRSVRHTARVRLTAIGATGASAQNRNLALLAARVLNFE